MEEQTGERYESFRLRKSDKALLNTFLGIAYVITAAGGTKVEDVSPGLIKMLDLDEDINQRLEELDPQTWIYLPDGAYMLTKGDGSKLRVHRRNHFYINEDGIPRIFVEYTSGSMLREEELRELERDRAALRLADEGFRAALSHASLYFWQYDLTTGVCTHELGMAERLGLPVVMENFPESLVKTGFIREDCIEAYLDLHRQLKAGASYVAADVAVVVPTGESFWRRIKYTRVEDEAGPKAFGTSESLEDYKRLEENFAIAAQQVGMSQWTLDIPNRRITAGGSAVTHFPTNEYGVISNVPDCFIERGVVHPEDAEKLRELYKKLENGALAATCTARWLRPDRGDWRWIQTNYTTIFERRQPVRAVGSSIDVTDRVEAQQKYEREVVFQDINSPNIIILVLYDITEGKMVRYRRDGRLESLPMGSRTYSLDEYRTIAAGAVVEDEGARNFFLGLTKEKLMEYYEDGRRVITLEYLRNNKDGPSWVSSELAMSVQPSDGHLMLRICLRDINDIKRKMDELSQAAETDLMTGLLNHDSFISAARQFLSGEGRQNTHALFMVDLDNFKLVNDNFGHQQGDKVLKKVSRVLAGAFRSTDLVGRVGGDEFMALMKNAGTLEAARHRAEELVQALQFNCSKKGRELQLTVSVGVAMFDQAGHDFYELYGRADSALYYAKNNGKNRYYFFSDTQGTGPEVPADEVCEHSSTVQLRTLLEYMDGGMILAEAEDDDIRIVYASPGVKRMLGQDEFFGGVLPEDADVLRSAMLDTAKTGKPRDQLYRTSEEGVSSRRILRLSRIPGDSPAQLVGVVIDAER